MVTSNKNHHKRLNKGMERKEKEKILKEVVGEQQTEEVWKLFRKFQKTFNLQALMQKMFEPTCSKSLGVLRILFGILMVVDIPDERGLAEIDIKYGDSMRCHFPLFNWLVPLSLEYMGLLFAIMWIGAAGMTIGFHFKLSCLCFSGPYWYLFLLDKTSWNNHSYLYGLVSLILLFSSAHHSYSLDAFLSSSPHHTPVPFWNYFLLRFQLFLMYFYAGLKKLDVDWLTGHSMTHLSSHWVFDPFKLLLDPAHIDLYVVHLFGFAFDLLVGFALLEPTSRPLALLLSSAFHLLNSRLFHIGQFPYVCLALSPVFCDTDWPEVLWKRLTLQSHKKDLEIKEEPAVKAESPQFTWKHRFTMALLASYVGTQLFLPYSHFITKGYNNWTSGLYGYSWDMMVHNWDSVLVVVRVVDRSDRGDARELYLDPEAWTEGLRYSKHGDMLLQYANCLKRNLALGETPLKDTSIYIDVWCSLNGRFQQRMFDPRQDLLQADWSPFAKTPWLMPLLTELSPWRRHMTELELTVRQWSNFSDTLFIADFPGLSLENYISPDLRNVTLRVLKGSVILEQGGVNLTLQEGEWSAVATEQFHRVHTLPPEPSCYVYAFVNQTMERNAQDTEGAESSLKENSPFRSLQDRFENFLDSLLILRACFYKLLFDIPIPIRSD